MDSNWNVGQSQWIYACAGTGIGLNFLLLYLIFTDSNHGRDGYRRMLAIVSCYNIYYAVVHCVMEVGILIDSSGFLAFSYSCARFGYWVSFFAIQLYSISFVISLLLLTIHCLYRYVKISGKFKNLFSRWPYLISLILVHILLGVLDVFFTTLTMRPSPERDEISRVALLQRYNLSIDQLGYLGPVYKLTNTSGSWVYVWPSIISTMSTVTLQVIVYCATCVCGVQLYIFVRKALVSNRSKSMNMQLLRLLMIQAITPLIFEYIPFFATLFGGFIGLPLDEASFYIPILVSCYSASEATMTIFGFTIYRERLLRVGSLPAKAIRASKKESPPPISLRSKSLPVIHRSSTKGQLNK